MKQLALHHLEMLKALIKASCMAYAADTMKALEACGFSNMSYKLKDNVKLGFENVTITATFNGHIVMINPTSEAGHWFVRKNPLQSEIEHAHLIGAKMTGPNLFRVNSISGLQQKLQG